jgi:uncharacterized protein
LNSLQREKLIIEGPAGALESVVEVPAAIGEITAVAVICHPHPLFGGTLDNKVVYTLARAFQEAAIATVRFNFRGVGKSAGKYAEGDGETQDAVAVMAYAQTRWPEAAVYVAGFSFGAGVALRATAKMNTRGLVTVAPALSYISLDNVQVPDCPWLVIQGEADELVDAKSVQRWSQNMQPSPELILLPGVGHFFHGCLDVLRAHVEKFIHAHRQ